MQAPDREGRIHRRQDDAISGFALQPPAGKRPAYSFPGGLLQGISIAAGPAKD